jgi:hypothetical protein
MTFKILTLNNISVAGLERLPRDDYEVASEIGHPDAVMLRSADVHEFEFPRASWPSPGPAPAPTTFRSPGSASAASPSSTRPVRMPTRSRNS